MAVSLFITVWFSFLEFYSRLSSQRDNPLSKYAKFLEKLIFVVTPSWYAHACLKKKIRWSNWMALGQRNTLLLFPFNVTFQYTVFYRFDLDVRDYIRSHSKSVRERTFFIWYASCYFYLVWLLNILEYFSYLVLD